MAERVITADDLVRGGCCWEGVMERVTPDTPAAVPLSYVLAQAEAADEVCLVREALDLDGYGGPGYGSGGGESGPGYGSGGGESGYGYGGGHRDGYGGGFSGDGTGDGGGGPGYGYGYGESGYGYGGGHRDGDGGYDG